MKMTSCMEPFSMRSITCIWEFLCTTAPIVCTMFGCRSLEASLMLDRKALAAWAWLITVEPMLRLFKSRLSCLFSTTLFVLPKNLRILFFMVSLDRVGDIDL